MNIYVSNLGDKITDESLRALFATHGEVSSSHIVLDGFTGYSRGFAFVEMQDDEQAEAAIQKINGCIVDGMAISVEKARPRTEHKGSYAVGRRK